MSNIQKEFIESTLLLLTREERNLAESETQFKSSMLLLAERRRSLIYRIKQAEAMSKQFPEFFERNSSSATSLIGLLYNLRFMEKENNDSPIERLLNWGLDDSDTPFIINEAYDILGKENARTLRSLIRDIVILIDPKRAGDI